MRLTVITSSTWIIAAAVDDRGRCSVREALDAVAVTDRAAHAQLFALLGKISLAGPPRDERRSRHLGAGVFTSKTTSPSCRHARSSLGGPAREILPSRAKS